jgi:hypothetical protein
MPCSYHGYLYWLDEVRPFETNNRAVWFSWSPLFASYHHNRNVLFQYLIRKEEIISKIARSLFQKIQVYVTLWQVNFVTRNWYKYKPKLIIRMKGTVYPWWFLTHGDCLGAKPFGGSVGSKGLNPKECANILPYQRFSEKRQEVRKDEFLAYERLD